MSKELVTKEMPVECLGDMPLVLWLDSTEILSHYKSDEPHWIEFLTQEERAEIGAYVLEGESIWQAYDDVLGDAADAWAGDNPERYEQAKQEAAA